MNDLFLERLKLRDKREKQFSQLFEEVNLEGSIEQNIKTEGNISEKTLKNMKLLLESKDKEIYQLKEIVEVKGDHLERTNNELISLDIENNLLQNKLATLQSEYDALIERWLLKAQQEADEMNSCLK